MCRVCMGRVCHVTSLLWAEIVMCRVDPIPCIIHAGPEKGKVQDKNSGCILMFEVAYLTDSFLKAVKIGQDSNWGWKMIRERIKRIHAIVCSGRDLRVYRWM